jgi:ribosome maturation factor RimP
MRPLFSLIMYRETLSKRVVELLESYLQIQGVELVELQLQQQGDRWFVRVFVDMEGGISLEDCRRLSAEIGQLLEAEDVIPISYILEVSSPGLDRPLRTGRDFQRQSQRMVTVFLLTPLMGKTQYTGRVVAVTEAHLVLHLLPDTPLTVPLSHIERGAVELEFK